MSSKRPRAPISFRWALLLGVLAILLAAVGVSGLFSYFNARRIVGDLSQDVLEQTGARVQDRLQSLLDAAAHMNSTRAEMLSRKAWQTDDLSELVQGFYDAIVLNPELSYVSVGLEIGAYAHVYRDPQGVLEGRIQVVGEDGRSLRQDYGFIEGKMKPLPDKRIYDTYDPRKRGWYQTSVAAGKQTWPMVYLFINTDPLKPDYPGLSCTTPVRAPDGKIQGVTTADFDLLALCRYLSELRVLKGGTALVIEVAPDGSPRVIAHPDPATLIARVTENDVEKEIIVPIDEIENAPVRTFVQGLDTRAETDGLQRTGIQADGVEYVAAYQWLESRHDLRWIVAFLVPRDALMAEVERASRQSLWIGLISLFLAAAVAWFLSSRIAKPLEHLAADTEAIGRFELNPSTGAVSRFAELRRLSDAMEEMKSGLRSFRRFVPADVVRGVLATGQEVSLGGERRELTVCFTDIEDFTTIAEQMPPEELVDLLGDYFEVVTDAFVASGGTVDKFIGDSVMAFWGAPRPQAEHAARACKGALDARDRVARLRRRLLAEGKHAIRVRFGVGTGELVVGNIGSSKRLNYTVIGDPVNLASRLESLNKMYGTQILIGEQTRAAAGDNIVARPLERVSVKGKVQGAIVYELLSMREDATPDVLALADAYAEALALYQSRDFEAARDAYERLLKANPADRAAFVLAQSCREYADNAPGDDWDGVRAMTSK